MRTPGLSAAPRSLGNRIVTPQLTGVTALAARTLRYAPLFGVRAGVRLAWLDFRGPPREVAVRWPGYPADLVVRAGTADVRTFAHVIATDGYDQPDRPDPAVIVDAGAHIGLASVWFANRYPNARVIALEPESANFDLLVRNTSAYANVEPRQAALWSSSGTIRLTDPGQGSWAFRVEGVADGDGATITGEVPCVALGDLIDELDLGRIDLLKVDIEGAEREVFAASQPWIDRVDAIAIELHDRHEPGCSRAFFAATAGFVDAPSRGEDTFVRRP